MNNTDNLSVKAPWIKNLGGVPSHLEYFQGSMYDKVAQIAVNYPDYIAYDFMGGKVKYKDFIRNHLVKFKNSSILSKSSKIRIT